MECSFALLRPTGTRALLEEPRISRSIHQT
jgi:hypothetical protein